MRTGISTLDDMIGGEILPGHSILLRGGPGSGKTTLALQIIAKHLSADKKRRAVFISLETSPRTALEYATQNYGFQFENSRCVCIDSLTLDGYVDREDPDPVAHLVKCLGDHIGQGQGNNVETLVVIDSLNVLVKRVSKPVQNERQVLASLVSKIQDNPTLGSAILLYIGEYYPSDEASLVSESFFCDIDILLSAEPVVGESGKPARQVSNLGYDMQRRIQSDTDESVTQAIEIRSFCRVLKSRHSRNQSRRCSYEIAPHHGMKFLETYPGDGQFIMFAENAPQSLIWDEFVQNEVRCTFPALRYERFGRPRLQGLFVRERRHLAVPEQSDMILTCLDTYWIRWYIELWQRANIREFVEVCLGKDEAPKTDAVMAAIVRTIHQSLEQDEFRFDTQLAEALAGLERSEQQSWPLTTEKRSSLIQARTRAQKFFQTGDGQFGLFRPLEEEEIRLFGESKAKIISELENPQLGWPVHRTRPNDPRLLSIPYNANVGFLVCRTDLLTNQLGQLERATLQKAIYAFFEDQRNALEEYQKRFEKRERILLPSKEDVEKEISKLVNDLFSHKPPKTWEEVLALCTVSGKHRHFLIETVTLSSYLSTLLEFLWATGADLIIDGNYEIKDEIKLRQHLFQAFYLVARMFSEKIIPQDSTLDANLFGRRFGDEEVKTQQDWLFARHWYSTLVDVLTAKKHTERGDDWEWTPPSGCALEIAPIPRTLASYVQESKDNKVPQHHSCWGEWHFALVRGSENKALAIDLINNLMSSYKIRERAFRNAALPTVDKFYDRYKNARCLDMPERHDLTLPTISYGELREQVFKDAKSRSQMFDFTHCMAVFHSLLEYIQGSPDKVLPSLGDEVDGVVRKIKEFRNSPILHHL